jgi:DNA repair protein RadC
VKNILKEVVIHDASAVVIAHNHPDGELMASNADVLMTRDIALALKNIDVELIDHILVANNRYASIMHTRYNI